MPQEDIGDFLALRYLNRWAEWEVQMALYGKEEMVEMARACAEDAETTSLCHGS